MTPEVLQAFLSDNRDTVATWLRGRGETKILDKYQGGSLGVARRLVHATGLSLPSSWLMELDGPDSPGIVRLMLDGEVREALGHWKVSTKGARSLHDALGKSEGLARGALVASIADWHVSTYVARPSGEYISLHGKDAIYRMGVQRAIEEAGKANVALALQHVKSAADAHPGLVPSVAGLRRTASLNLAGFQRRLEEMRAVQL